MPELYTLLLAACMLAGAALYTSVGHAGASAYITLMALFGVAPAVMRPTALALNILVASFTSFRYLQAGLFRWRTLWPFLIGAMPLALIGGAVQLPGQVLPATCRRDPDYRRHSIPVPKGVDDQIGRASCRERV